MSKPFPITITAQMRHGILWEARQKLGSNKALGDFLGLSQSRVGALLNFRQHPGEHWMKTHGGRVELKLSELLCRPVTIAEVFPPELCSERFQQLNKRVEHVIEVDPERLLGAGVSALPAAPDEVVAQGELKDLIGGLLDGLTERQRQVLELRFGLDGNGERTLQETGDEIGISRGRAQQIEARALRRLRHPAKSRLLRPFLERQA